MNIVGRLNEIHLINEEDTARIAKMLADALIQASPLPKAINCWLIGDLGTGKTTFTRYLLRTLGHSGKVKSPTYNLCEPYQLQSGEHQISAHHFDLYRMNHPKEWEEAGFRDILTSPGICIIEWPEKAEGTLPMPDLIIRMNYVDEQSRKLSIEAYSEMGNQLMREIH